MACRRELSNILKVRHEDDMDVDDEGEAEGDNEEEPDGDEEMDQDEPHTPKKPQKKKPRKSEIDLIALANEQEALATLTSNEVLHLKLRKRYYAEALNFVRQVEGGMETVQKLLASTNKLEVLEAIEFFRVTYEYAFDGAEVRVL